MSRGVFWEKSRPHLKKIMKDLDPGPQCLIYIAWKTNRKSRSTVCADVMYLRIMYTVNHEKGDTLFFTITLANLNRFL